MFAEHDGAAPRGGAVHPETVANLGGHHVARQKGRRAYGSAAVCSEAKVPFFTAVRAVSIRWAPRGDQRIC